MDVATGTIFHCAVPRAKLERAFGNLHGAIGRPDCRTRSAGCRPRSPLRASPSSWPASGGRSQPSKTGWHCAPRPGCRTVALRALAWLLRSLHARLADDPRGTEAPCGDAPGHDEEGGRQRHERRTGRRGRADPARRRGTRRRSRRSGARRRRGGVPGPPPRRWRLLDRGGRATWWGAYAAPPPL